MPESDYAWPNDEDLAGGHGTDDSDEDETRSDTDTLNRSPAALSEYCGGRGEAKDGGRVHRRGRRRRQRKGSAIWEADDSNSDADDDNDVLIEGVGEGEVGVIGRTPGTVPRVMPATRAVGMARVAADLLTLMRMTMAWKARHRAPRHAVSRLLRILSNGGDRMLSRTGAHTSARRPVPDQWTQRTLSARKLRLNFPRLVTTCPKELFGRASGAQKDARRRY